AHDIDDYADHLLPTLERAKLPREFEVVIRDYNRSSASFKVEALTGRVRSIDVQYHSKSTLSTSNIQDLSTTVIHLEILSNKHLSAGYLGTVQDDWSFTVNKMVLATDAIPTDILILAQFLQTRPVRLSFPAFELVIDESDPTIVPPLTKLLEECQALQDTRIQLDMNYARATRHFTDISSQEAARYLTQRFPTH
ncbi:hypothetical protein BGZ91_008700, partial [Linnemannia elongata]